MNLVIFLFYFQLLFFPCQKHTILRGNHASGDKYFSFRCFPLCLSFIFHSPYCGTSRGQEKRNSSKSTSINNDFQTNDMSFDLLNIENDSSVCKFAFDTRNSRFSEHITLFYLSVTPIFGTVHSDLFVRI